ncbi:MAG: type III polyketide synthase [Actinobacteria bacterium]|nr:type III polyketide synthase [Actinomycetota bacterium]
MPARREQRRLWEGFFAGPYAQSPVARRVWRNAGVERRHGVVDPCVEDVSGWGTAQRMRRFLAEAVPLGKEALGACLHDAGLAPTEVGLLTVVSCTGYATPGLDILLARDLGMRESVQRLHVGHMGCYAALPGLAAAADAAAARGKVALLLCLELPSLHVQPRTDEIDVEQVVAHALFGDAAAAVAVTPGAARAGSLRVVDVAARTDQAHAGMMSWDVTDRGFRMGLSPRVPDVVRRHVGEVVTDLLDGSGVCRDDVVGWAIHPGGPRVIDVVQRELGLSDAAVAPSRGVLRDCGNCSSATVLLIIDRIVRRRPPEPGTAIVSLAFGPGLTLYAALLRA